MFATKVLRQAAAHAERTPMIHFLGKRTIPSSVDHTPKAHPASPSHELPEGFGTPAPKTSSFSAYRQNSQNHGPLGRTNAVAADGTLGSTSGHSLGSVAPAQGEFFDRSELPVRFRRTPFSEIEMEAIETGGASLSA